MTRQSGLPRGTDAARAKVSSLRRNQTDAEKALWRRLRNRALEGFKFRRQHAIGPYIVDFFCEQRNLVVELDGGQHAEQSDREERRTKFLLSCGCDIVRFWNNDVLVNMDGVLQRLLERLNPVGRQSPLPPGEEGARREATGR